MNATEQHEVEVGITDENDIVSARKAARSAAVALGFGLTDVTRIVTAASELARNINLYAGTGAMRCREVRRAEAIGLEVVFEDTGPGIPDVEQALTPGYSTRGGLGLGLPGVQKLMDEMEIESSPRGTRVVTRKWLPR